jgi:hypothetical protein
MSLANLCCWCTCGGGRGAGCVSRGAGCVSRGPDVLLRALLSEVVLGERFSGAAARKVRQVARSC